MNKHFIPAAAVAATLLALGSTAAQAQQAPATSVTRGATAMTSTIPTRSPYGADNLFDQVGLDTAYVNGSTAFASFAANARHFSSTTLATAQTNVWLGNTSTGSGLLNFDLGANYTIDGMAWFNLAASAGARVTSLNVYADTDNDASNGTGALLFTSGSFGDAAGSSGTTIAANVFSFSQATTTRYLTVELLSNAGSPVTIGAGEVVFSQVAAAVPEPGSHALMAAGLAAVGLIARRRRAER